ncbi:SDR family NAD(P)-dependent oxidoreductase [Kibdelosporangium philippinense]|uniref:SDR family NAD(P)-dependent oxidoreductase n=1 Tax=Kibdelosporangium philippinense TaxID=211113 RepID=A0ABS8ZA16_9PSEU|nr:SDR family NAD(P)-dependent oxidoreductase [Kibdelosporangium philippinense]MCE7003984.1 SDR family NAD(P)-dependent oxidoreductase [Kibdelosporangium philippinense]
MSNTLAVFGAGSGLGLATARRFARAGFRVALVGRTPSKLDALADRIAGETTTFAADVTDHARLAEVVAQIGEIDVVAFGATGMDEVMARPVGLDAAALRFQLELRLVAPVVLTGLVLPGMVARGSGTLLYATGTSAVEPVPMISNVGAAAAGLRNYVHSLHAEIADSGVYAGLLVVGGIVRGSEAQQRFVPDGGFPLLEPADLAERLWDLYTGRDQVELVVKPELSVAAGKTES